MTRESLLQELESLVDAGLHGKADYEYVLNIVFGKEGDDVEHKVVLEAQAEKAYEHIYTVEVNGVEVGQIRAGFGLMEDMPYIAEVSGSVTVIGPEYD